MLTNLSRRSFITLFAVCVSMAASAGIVYANHSWGSYHWARTVNPFTLKLGDNVSGAWDPYLTTASTDWSLSTVLDTTIVAGQGGKSCRATSGRVEICNKKYGNNGWLGIAQIWASGNHITQGVVKMNDTYFNTAMYNTPAWRNLVLCQEVGHTFGLDHQDENFSNLPLGTCMDYSNDPVPNQHPNVHDYEQLELIYAHLDSTTTVKSGVPGSGAADVDVSDRKEWGKVLKQDGKGKPSLHVRDLGSGEKVFTFVVWADGEE